MAVDPFAVLAAEIEREALTQIRHYSQDGATIVDFFAQKRFLALFALSDLLILLPPNESLSWSARQILFKWKCDKLVWKEDGMGKAMRYAALVR